jgi:UrcA family protein
MKKLTILVAVATFTVCSFTIARAGTAFEPRTMTVRFADLDTTNAEGAAVLYRRLKFAADVVCQDLDSGRDLFLVRQHADCVRLALSNAIAKVDRPAVTAYAAGRGVVPATVSVKIASNK